MFCVIVTAMSANVSALTAASTMVVAVALLLAGFESGVLLETEFVSDTMYAGRSAAERVDDEGEIGRGRVRERGFVQMTTPPCRRPPA